MESTALSPNVFHIYVRAAIVRPLSVDIQPRQTQLRLPVMLALFSEVLSAGPHSLQTVGNSTLGLGAMGLTSHHGPPIADSLEYLIYLPSTALSSRTHVLMPTWLA